MAEQIGEDDVAAKVAGDGPRVDDGVEDALAEKRTASFRTVDSRPLQRRGAS
jgi:hypothetical protein